MELKKKRAGRPKFIAETNDKAKGYNVSLKPSEEKKIVAAFGSLSKALKKIMLTLPNPAAFALKSNSEN